MVEQAEETLPTLTGLSLLLLDDDPNIVRSLVRVLEGLGAKVAGVGSLREARLALEALKPDAVLADLQLKDGSGLDLLADYLGGNPSGAFYLITGHGSIDNAVDALRQGARNYFEKPVEPLALARRLAQDLAHRRDEDHLAEILAPYMLYCDSSMTTALSDLPRFSASGEPVLIHGETGTGKELVARALHGLGPRSEGPFVAVNCGAIPETMLEAELFGYERGAFTGASRQHRGRFEQAHRGTLFLDEIGEMLPAAQVSLLRVLEEHSVQRIGSEHGTAVDVRVLAASHRPLEDRVEAGLFRQDLLFRLNVLLLQLPPLRQRPGDIALLSRHFLANSLRDMGWAGAVPTLTEAALDRLAGYGWPGNVRELRNLMARLAVRLPQGVQSVGETLIETLLPSAARKPQQEGVFIPRGSTLAEAEWLLIDAALKDHDFNRAKAARVLGIGERTLRRKLNES